jgi:hypothetical protein
MSDFLDEVQTDCLEAETDLGGKTLAWAARGESPLTYPGASTTLKRGATLVIGGKEVEITLTVRVRWSGTTATGRAWSFGEMTDLPKQGDRITWGGKPYRIAQVTNAHDTFLEIDLMDVNR